MQIHHRDRMFHAKENPVNIDRVLTLPRFQRHFGNGTCNRDPGIIHQNIQTALVLFNTTNNLFPTRFFAHVLREIERFPTTSSNSRDGLRAPFIFNIGEIYDRAFCDESLCSSQPNTSSRSGYQCNLAI